MNKENIEYFKKVVSFLGEALGKNYEVAFHIISEDGSYLEDITNNHISGRSKNAPLTDLALKVIKDELYKTQDYITGYRGFGKANKDIVGSTFFIKEEGKLVGMLCINADISIHKDIAKQVLQLGNSNFDLLESEKTEKDSEIVEHFSESLEDILNTIVDPRLLRKDVQLKQEQRINIVKELENKGVFQLKGAVAEVANLLNVSEPSIYRYLKSINKHK